MADRLDKALDELGEAIREVRGQQPSAPAPTLAAGIDLTRWKLTLPVRVGGKVVEVPPPALGIYQDKYFAKVDGAHRFRVWHGGDTTSGSPNPRSELRELNPDGSLAKWSTTKGRHELTVDTQVNRLTKVRPHVVLAQIHGGDDDVTVFRLEGSKLYVTKGDDTHAHLVTDSFELGRRYRLGIVVEGGQVSYTVDGALVGYALKVADSSCYFKAGNYLQSNPTSAKGESSEEYAEVVVYGIDLRHAA